MDLQYIIYKNMLDLCQRILQKVLLHHQIKIPVTVSNCVKYVRNQVFSDPYYPL